MTIDAANALLQRVEGDQALAAELAALKGDPQAVLDRARAEGFDFDPADARQAFLERYPEALTIEQLDQIAAGTDWNTVGLVAGVGGGTAVAGVAAGLIITTAVTGLIV